MTTEREQVLASLEEARKELLAAIDGLGEEQLSRGGCVGEWSAKDVLSHIAFWDEVVAQDFRRLARGDAPALTAFDLNRVDEYNGTFMSFRLHFSAAQARRELDAGREALLDSLKALPDTQLAQGQFARVLSDVEAHHDSEHAQTIREWRRKQGL